MVYSGIYHLFYQYDPTSALGTGPKVCTAMILRGLIFFLNLLSYGVMLQAKICFIGGEIVLFFF